ncbi:MAG: hypothetical protein WAV07_15825 [Candidatus Contendobacter sp.]
MAALPRPATGILSQCRGFILVATLWLLALLTVAATYLAAWTAEATDSAWREQQAWRAEMAARGTEAAVLYLLSTRRFTVAGLTLEPPLMPTTAEELDNLTALPVGDELALDDRRYRGLGETVFALQDEAGLVGLTRPDATQLGQLLGLLEIPLEQRGPLIAKLEDYSDTDDLYRLNGAEARQYQDRGLPAPPNRELLASWETRQVLDWAGHANLWRDQRLPRLTTALPAGIPNPNTAPLLDLQTIPGVDAEIAHRIVAGRPYLSYYALNLAIGIPLPVDEMSLSFLPSDQVRLTLSHPDWPWRREIHIELTPRKKPQPWLIDYVLDIPTDDAPASSPAPVASAVFAPAPATAPERPR